MPACLDHWLAYLREEGTDTQLLLLTETFLVTHASLLSSPPLLDFMYNFSQEAMQSKDKQDSDSEKQKVPHYISYTLIQA